MNMGLYLRTKWKIEILTVMKFRLQRRTWKLMNKKAGLVRERPTFSVAHSSVEIILDLKDGLSWWMII